VGGGGQKKKKKNQAGNLRNEMNWGTGAREELWSELGKDWGGEMYLQWGNGAKGDKTVSHKEGKGITLGKQRGSSRPSKKGKDSAVRDVQEQAENNATS